MKLYSSNDNYKLYEGSMLDMLEVIKPNTIDSVICDPPYELNFMNKGWDNSGIAFQPDTWKKCYEVLKPGGYLLAFGGSRTFHRIACAIEDAGFEIRDTIMWLYGSGFPKSMNIGLAIDKKNGVESEIIGKYNPHRDGSIKKHIDNSKFSNLAGTEKKYIEGGLKDLKIPTLEISKRWQGWGTALKPSFEPIIVARKPFKGSLVDNVIEYGVGGINIDECRVDYNGEIPNIGGRANHTRGEGYGFKALGEECVANTSGRFPANTILTYDETDFDEVCGGFPNTKSTGGHLKAKDFSKHKGSMMSYTTLKEESGVIDTGYIAPCDYGSASRYFYCAKASKKDRDEGLDEFKEVDTTELLNRKPNTAGILWEQGGTNAFSGAGGIKKNTHPTVKPTELMQYLIRLVSPDGATILDCFNGSGSTGKAVMYENKERNKNYKYIGIELTEEYLPIAKARIEYVMNSNIETETIKETINDTTMEQTTIFDLI